MQVFKNNFLLISSVLVLISATKFSFAGDVLIITFAKQATYSILKMYLHSSSSVIENTFLSKDFVEFKSSTKHLSTSEVNILMCFLTIKAAWLN